MVSSSRWRRRSGLFVAAVIASALVASCSPIVGSAGVPETCISDGSTAEGHQQCLSSPNNDAISNDGVEDVDNQNHEKHDSETGTNFDLDKANRFRNFLEDLLEEIDAYEAATENAALQAQEQMVLSKWLKYFNMDPDLITQMPVTSNWLEQLYQKTKALAPNVFLKVWDHRAKPTTEDLQVLLRTVGDDDDDAFMDEDLLMHQLFLPFRHRGYVMILLDTFCRLFLGPLRTISYAIPSQENIAVLSYYAPIVEVGAGTGYWSAVLQQQGVDTDPYDAHPPGIAAGDEDGGFVYFYRTYTKVQEGDCRSVFAPSDEATGANAANNRTLLLVWPNNPDNVDNAEEFHSSRLPPVWDVACVKAFVAAGGTTVILVAERETNVHVLPPGNHPDSGLCATRELQSYLLDHFYLVHQMDVPTWYYSDDLTIWKKKK